MKKKTPIRVAVLGLRGFPNVQGGIEKHCQELYTRMVKYSVVVTAIGRKKYISENPYTYDGVTLMPLWAIKHKYLEAIVHTTYGVLWLVRHRKKYDLLHIHGIGPSLLTHVARLLGLHVVTTNHGPDYNRQKWGWFAKFMLRLGERIGAKHAYLVIGVSKNICKNLFKKFRTVSAYIPNGVHTPEKIPAGETLTKYGLKKGKYILAVGRLVPEKGFHDLIDAFSGLNGDWELVIVGDADHRDSYSESLKEKALHAPRVVMTGFLKGRNLGEIYSNAGLFVLPSYHEGLPIVGLEAMGYQLPMVLSDIPANLEIAMPHEIFPVGDVPALRGKLKEFISQPEAWTSLEVVNSKLERLDKEFNWDIIAQRTAHLYEKVVSLPKSTHAKVRRRDIEDVYLAWHN